MSKFSIPFNRPNVIGTEIAALTAMIEAGRFSGDGPETRLCQAWFQERLSAPASFFTPSCSLALDMAMLVLELQPGDEVLIPDFTFVSTAQSVALRGGVPVFCDVRTDTLNIDASKLRSAITPRTRAILPVHYAGVSADMHEICEIANEYDLHVVEDAAQAIGCTFDGRPVGSMGTMSAFSFHATKNIHCGEGGMLVLNEQRFVDLAHIVWEKGTDRRQFLEGRADKYDWKALGNSFPASEVNAAMLAAQLAECDNVNNVRRRIWNKYYEALLPFQQEGKLQLPHVPENCDHNGHIFYALFNSNVIRDEFIRVMKSCGIEVVFHYQPLHLSEAGARYGRAGMDVSNSTDVANRLVRLPLFPDLSEAEQDHVINSCIDFLEKLS